MNKFIYLFAMILSLSLWSCGKDDDGVDDPNNPNNPGNPDNVTLELSTKDLVFEAQGGELTFDITCNADWTITNESDWCTLDMTSGNGNATVKVSTGVYEENEDRNTVLTVKAGDTPQTLTITQKHEDALILSKDKFDVPQAGDNITIELRSNIECALTIPSRFQEWISESPSGKGMETKTFNLTIKENEAFETREGFVIISGNELKDTVHIFQVANERTLILTQDTYDVPAAGETLEVELKTNVDYNMEIPDMYSWVRRSYARALRTDKIQIEVLENKSYDNRQAIVIFQDRNSDLTDTLYIFQTQVDALILGEKSFTVAGKGEDINVTVKTNVDYAISHPNWISQQPASKALREEQLTFRIAENTGTEPRTGEIILKDRNSALADTVHVTQSTKDSYSGDVVLTTTEEVKAFAEMGYKKIDGSLIVEGNELTTLSQLNNQLEEIRDSLIINGPRLINLDGLYSLKKVGGNVNIKNMGSSSSLEGLNNLESIGGNLEIHARNSISVKGLSKLQSIDGSFKVYDRTWYENFTSFEGMEKLTNIKGDLEINGYINNLESFKGLSGLQSIGGSFKIITTDGLNSLVSFEGLENLTNIKENFEIKATTSGSSSKALNALASFKGLESLSSIGENFEINVEGSFTLGVLASFEGLGSLASIGGNFKINATGSGLYDLASFKGLENLASVGGNFEINTDGGLRTLASFEGLENLASISGNFEINAGYGLDALASFEGLGNLASIGGNFEIHEISGIDSFKGLDKLKQINGDFNINWKRRSSSFEGLSSLESIGGDFIAKPYYISSGYDRSSYIKVENHLSHLTTVGGNMEIQIENYSSGALDANFNSLESVGGSLSLSGYKYSNGYYYISQSGTLYLPLLQAIGGECSFNGFDLIDFPNLESINGTLEISYVNSIGTLDKLKSVEDITISNCSNLYDFCNWIPVLTDYNGTFLVTNCGYNPTKYQILNGECSQTPAN